MVESIGGYEVLARVSTHDSYSVTRARNPRSGRVVAMKQVAAASTAVAARVAAYVRIVEMLHHPNIVQIHEVLRTPDEIYLVEDWVDGVALDELGEGPLDGSTAVAVLLGVLAGLAHMHDRGVVHGNVCPATVLLSGQGEPRLIDFGLTGPFGSARAGNDGRFAAPEVAAGRVLIPASDVYSSAVVLLEVTARADETSGPVPGLTRRIGTVLATALDPVPEQRFPDARVFLHALEAAASESYGARWRAKVDLARLVPSADATVSARLRGRRVFAARSRAAARSSTTGLTDQSLDASDYRSRA